MPLLSIIIPTKNRQETAIAAVRTALAIDSQDIEIVVQDCSEDDSLRAMLLQFHDGRIKYHYQSGMVSMTENWNRAYGNATGDYQIGIGDDDAVFKEIYQVAIWAKRNQVEAVGHTEPYLYFWPNYPVFHVKRRFLFKTFTGKITAYRDLREIVLKRSRLCDNGYGIDLPMVYHRLISKQLLDKLKMLTGKLLDGTSLDVYSAFALGLICKDFRMIDYPFSMRGASGKSNSGRFVKKEDKMHFDEYQDIDYPEWMPNLKISHVTIAESIYRAFVNTGNQDLIANIDKSYLYASCVNAMPKEKKYIMGLVENHLSHDEIAQFHATLKRIKREKHERKYRTIKHTLNKFNPIIKLYRLMRGEKIIYLDDTVAVQEYHDALVSRKRISLELPDMLL
jgi:glycosyltransferase involved in cell wall biosynthesis